MILDAEFKKSSSSLTNVISPKDFSNSRSKILANLNNFLDAYQHVLTHEDFDDLPYARKLVEYVLSLALSNAQNERYVFDQPTSVCYYSFCKSDFPKPTILC